MAYVRPKQARSKEAEEAFLDALESVLEENGYAQTTVEQVANRAGKSKSALLSRFGSKKTALLALFDRYCLVTTSAMVVLAGRVPDAASAFAAVQQFSVVLERLQTDHFASNRAMHELFLEDLRVDERTQKIFRELIDLMRLVQRHHLNDHPYTDTGAFSAAQMLVTTNYNYVLKAMPALPRDANVRHRMIATMVVEALKF